jgi:hypothetical protein
VKGNLLFCNSAISKMLIVALVVVLVVGIAAGAYYLRIPTLSPAPSPTPTTVELGDAIAGDLVDATISGDGL